MFALSVGLSTILYLVADASSAKAEVSVENNAFQNVRVSFSSNVSPENGQSLVQVLQDLLQNTSRTLHRATGYRIGSVSFHLPDTWDTSEWQDIEVHHTSGEIVQGDVIVDATSGGAFGNQPFAHQYGGCGVGGLSVTVPVEFLQNSEQDEHYPRDKLLAREWLKYRFGVFDENGFQEDKLYPTLYKVPGSDTEVRITECTDPQVEFELKTIDGETCSIESNEHCIPQPTHQNNSDVRSSLMFFHEKLPQVDMVCGRLNHVHNANSYSKHNTLCEGRSVWDVIAASEDHTNYQETEWTDEEIQFSFHQESGPRVVVAIEKTKNLKSQYYPITFATARLVLDLSNPGKTGVYTFSKETEPPLKTLGDPSTELTISEFFQSPEEVCTACALVTASEALMTDSPDTKGNVVLVTASPFSGDAGDLLEKLPNSKLCLTIVLFAASDDAEHTLVQSYKPVVDALPCTSVHTLNISNSNQGEIFDRLNSLLRSNLVLRHAGDVAVKEVVSGVMTHEAHLSFHTSSEAGLYKLWYNRPTGNDEVSCKLGDASINLETFKGTAYISYSTFEPPQEDGEIICSMTHESEKPPLTQVQMETKPGHYFEADVWTRDSTPKNETRQMPVEIYFKLAFDHSPIEGAQVFAVVHAGDQEKTVNMFDNGRGDPDITQNDGIYSGYFLDFVDSENQEYNVTVVAIKGFAQTVKKGSDHCCGSAVNTKSAGPVEKFEIYRSTTFSTERKKPEDGYPPSRTNDLRVTVNGADDVLFTWTAPGGGKAKHYSIKAFTSRKDALENFNEAGQTLTATFAPSRQGKDESFKVADPDLDKLEKNSTYFVALRSTSTADKQSRTSNAVEFFVPTHTATTSTPEDVSPTPDGTKDTGHSPKKTTIIVVSVLASVIVLCIIIYVIVFFVFRKRRRDASDKDSARGGNTNPNVNIPLGGPQLNSIPADVILKHHSEVVNAKNLHKEPPIFKEENLDSFDSTSTTPDASAAKNNNVPPTQYTLMEKRRTDQEQTTPQDPSKSPKRMTVV